MFIPIYTVTWLASTNKANPLANLFSTNNSKPPNSLPWVKATVELFAPTDTLLQLTVDDPKYNLRRALVFTNLAELVGGTNILALANMPIVTNTSSTTKPIVAPLGSH